MGKGSVHWPNSSCRHHKEKRRTCAGFALGAHLAAVGLNNVFHNRKAQPRAALVGPEK